MAKSKKFITCDGNYAAAYVSYMFSEGAFIYPITPSSTMAEYVDEWSANGKLNMFGEPVKVSEMQSEGGAAGALHGALQAGVLSSTYTASQGLLLMIPNMYKIAGELLPAVFHVSARSIAAHALSIFGDHSDVYATRQTGFAFLASGSVQESMDLAGVAHLTAIKSRVPFVHFFDGFRTSAEIQKIEAIDVDDMIKLVDWDSIQAFRDRALNPEHPVTRGTAQNPDIFFQAKEAANPFYDVLPDLVAHYMDEISRITGRTYQPFTYYGAADAERIIVAMGSVTETTKEVIDYLMKKGEKVGLVTVHLYRPFSAKYFFKVLPKSVQRIAVLDRTKEVGANGDPLYLDVRDLFYGQKQQPLIVGGRYGLSSKDTTPSQIFAVYENLKLPEPKNQFTIGIVDDVTFKSLPIQPDIQVETEGTISAKFYGIGSDGTVGANKNSIKIIGDATEKYCQAYFAYDSKKSGGITISHLRFGDMPIRSPYFVSSPDFVACHVPSYVFKYRMLKGLKVGGAFLLNTSWGVEETKQHLPDAMKKYLAKHQNRFYIIDANKISQELGLGNRINTIMQSAFFKISGVIPFEKAVSEMKQAIEKTYGRKGDAVVQMNYAAVDAGAQHVIQVNIPADWALLEGKRDVAASATDAFIQEICDPINQLEGDSLPVSAFVGREDGTFPAGTTQFEKRGIATSVPEWQPDLCIQCNQCAYVCPHAVIRPFLLDEKEMKNAPEGTATLKAIGKSYEGLQFRIQVSPLDCTGCGNCAEVCPATKGKALVMKPLQTQMAEEKWFEYFVKNVTYKDQLMPKNSVKTSQFAQPLFEFSGACAGCGETPYIKLITQLFGERMVIANATGCSSIYGGSAPATPYTVHQQSGKGPAWANSLFEDNAEYGFGMAVGIEKQRERIYHMMSAALAAGGLSDALAKAFQDWIAGRNDAAQSEAATAQLLPLLKTDKSQVAADILGLSQYLVKKSVWIFGGDGWAYDIGYGGLDHVLASGQNVNLLVMDTEVYSNTGGQASKSTPVGAVAKFAASGKKIRKKDLGMMAMSYGYVYVAQVAMGASQSQYLKAIQEAEAYDGPSIIIAYAPCINHGLDMGKSQLETKRAVEAGYWHLYRYNPMLELEGKNPFTLDSKEPDWSKFQGFLQGEVRYSSLKKSFPKEADELFSAAEQNAKWRYQSYVRLSKQDFSFAPMKEAEVQV